MNLILRSCQATILKGTTVILTEGHYGEYQIDVVFKALRSFNIKEHYVRYRKIKTDSDETYSTFIDYLIKNKTIRLLENLIEVNLSDATGIDTVAQRYRK